jgi:hypothetical protein
MVLRYRFVINISQIKVDYVFGKRPDKSRKGKMEYRVMWKDFTIEEATWEPEESLVIFSKISLNKN